MNQFRLSIYCLFGLLPFFSIQGEPSEDTVKRDIPHPALSPEKLEVPSRYLQPLLVASRVFSEQQPEAEMKNFLVWIYPTHEGIAVSFIRERVIEKGPPLKVYRRGDAGRSMLVIINPENFELVRWSYQR